MALEQCTVDGRPGWRSGKKGTCHTGKQGKAKAMRDVAEGPVETVVTKAATKSASTVKAKASPKKKAPAKKKAAAKKK